ncbi:TPA: DNA-binding protein [bacterium]|nr:DNA-binding protein [bacterium]
MTKQDLVDKVAAIGLTKKQAGAAVDALVNGIKDALKKGDKVQLIGFGSFSVKKRAARTGRNPRTGAEIKLPAKKVPVFKPGDALKRVVG